VFKALEEVMSVGKVIKRLRIVRNLSKSELARRVNVSPTAVNNWEEWGTTPRDDLMPAIAAALNTTVATLTGKVPAAAASISPKSARDSAAAVIESKEKIAELFGVQPAQVSVSISF
jgi:transcriptional regulator with XRE-family HTH domain